MSISALFNALLFALIGIVVYGVCLVFLGKALPGNLWKRAVEGNEMAAALILAAVALALGWIVAAAVH